MIIFEATVGSTIIPTNLCLNLLAWVYQSLLLFGILPKVGPVNRGISGVLVDVNELPGRLIERDIHHLSCDGQYE